MAFWDDWGKGTTGAGLTTNNRTHMTTYDVTSTAKADPRVYRLLENVNYVECIEDDLSTDSFAVLFKDAMTGEKIVGCNVSRLTGHVSNVAQYKPRPTSPYSFTRPSYEEDTTFCGFNISDLVELRKEMEHTNLTMEELIQAVREGRDET